MFLTHLLAWPEKGINYNKMLLKKSSAIKNYNKKPPSYKPLKANHACNTETLLPWLHKMHL
jgi:hypothetical protein